MPATTQQQDQHRHRPPHERSGLTPADQRGYRSLLQFTPRPATRVEILAQLGTWFGEHDLNPTFERSDRYTSDVGELLVLVRDVESGFEFSAEFAQPTDAGVWTSLITARLPRTGDGWCLIDVTNDRGRTPGPPRLAKYVMGIEECRDGAGVLQPEPRIVRQAAVDEALEIVCDPDRRGLVFLAGTTTDRDVDGFVRRVEWCTRETVGMAQVLVLDPLATEEFNREIGSDHAVLPWGLRTFFPEADPASRVDARRHKMLGEYRLGNDEKSKTRAMLGHFARTQARATPLPGAVTKQRRSFVRMSDTLVIGAPPELRAAPTKRAASGATPVPRSAPRFVPSAPPNIEPDDPGATEAVAQIALVKEIFGLESVDAESLAALVEENRQAVSRASALVEARQAKIDSVEDDLAALSQRLDTEQLDLAESEDERGQLADENRWLRGRLRDKQDYEGASSSAPSEALTTYPGNFVELLDRLRSSPLDGVLFTGDPASAITLDRLDTLGLGVRWAWESLLVLADYRQAKVEGSCQSNVHSYLSEQHDRRKVPVKRHVPVESGRTMQQWGDERVFPVPASVDPSGYVTMEPHFRLHTNDTTAPRMHYLDHTGIDGMIYVGYIGKHLTNTKTARA